MRNNFDNKVSSYLYYNYLSKSEDVSWLQDAIGNDDKLYGYTPIEAAKILENSVHDVLKMVGTEGYLVVPISGGWDSRILLGAVMDYFGKSKIKTLSFGTPGQLDYDIGKQIAQKFGLEHHAIDLSKVELTWESLLKSVKESPWSYVPDGYFNRLALSQVIRSAKDVVVSGFMGDPLTGGHLSSAITKNDAIEEFVTKQLRVKTSRLYRHDYDPRSILPVLPESSLIPYSEVLDLGIRQASCIASIVTPQMHWKEWGGDMGRMPSTGARVVAPFVQKEWATYWLNAPKELKRRQKLYLDMMHYKFPDLATMPSKYSLGTSTKISYLAAKVRRKIQIRLNSVFPKMRLRYCAELNYLDYSDAFRNREDYRLVLDTALKFLKENDVTPWLDLDGLKRDHMLHKANHENSFLILIGLALNIEADTVL